MTGPLSWAAAVVFDAPTPARMQDRWRIARGGMS